MGTELPLGTNCYALTKQPVDQRLPSMEALWRITKVLIGKAFRRLGGVTRVVVLDNLREGVLAPDIYDPTVNPLYRDMLQHYKVVALPCRVRDPDRKGKVERGVGHAKNTPLKGLRFESLEEAQNYRTMELRITREQRIVLAVAEGVSEQRCPGVMIYELDYHLQVVDCRPDSHLSEAHRALELQGLLDHPWTEEENDRLRSEVVIKGQV